LSKSKLVSLFLGLCLVNLIVAGAVSAQWADERLALFDSLVARSRALDASQPVPAAMPRGAWGNIGALAARWPTLRPVFARMALGGEPMEDWIFDAKAVAASAGGNISSASLGNSRLSGFTQNETSTAWCGASVVVVFSDTGSEVNSFESSGGGSALGYSASANKGSSYSYSGAPSPPTDAYQMMLGEPSIVCANQNTFYYAGTWWDAETVLSGVALALSSNGGKSYGQPVIAIGKDGFTHIIVKDSLAIDKANPNLLYMAYVDQDFSSDVCGVFPGSDPNAGYPIPRYAIELVSSANAGAAWSSPVVIEQVCADDADPNAFVEGPSAIVGPGGVVYVTWETMGENGGQLTDRNIKIAVSSNAGISFTLPVPYVSTVNPVGDGADLQGLIQAAEYPSIAIGGGKSNAGFVYLVWDNGSTDVNDVLSTTGVYGFSDIMFTQSRDGGVAWSSPIRVNTNQEGGGSPYSDQFEPMIGTDSTGRIGVCFYDRHRDPNNFLIDRTCASSTNGGSTWSSKLYTKTNFPSVVGQDVLVAPDYFGDYDAVVTDNTNATKGFIDSFATSVGGNPNVTTNHF